MCAGSLNQRSQTSAFASQHKNGWHPCCHFRESYSFVSNGSTKHSPTIFS
uniref:Uncharacterized protein n=1 Tax=Arundo donax TaxID=35708 RepID=A0A0A9HN50_ARUDO